MARYFQSTRDQFFSMSIHMTSAGSSESVYKGLSNHECMEEWAKAATLLHADELLCYLLSCACLKSAVSSCRKAS